MKKNIHNANITSWLLRIGLAVVFLYAGISSLQHPLEWVGFLPAFLTKIVTATTVIKVFAIYELVLVAWLISGRFLKYSALVCALTLCGIVITNPSQLITTFRDIGLACMAFALFFIE
ncbi:MAG TPA: DoxX family membrane protein [Verrucomicrobiae bacterium]|nr:DoxX family membrane protein [Verrucomicrobiae bacterium]